MSYFSLEFVIFIVSTVIIISLIHNTKIQNIVLLIASYIFYSWSDVRFSFLLFGISITAWYLGEKISKSDDLNKRKLYLSVGVVICLTTLCAFKYLGFFIVSFNGIFHYDGVLIDIVLPLGISFYILQAISYLADVYTRKIDSVSQPYKVLLYIGFFPQIVSGPIVKAHDFIPQLERRETITWRRFAYGLQMIVIGILKKKVMADRLAVSVNSVFETPEIYSGLSLLVASIGYAIQIYCDFSGYSDIAIGIAYIIGFDLGKNFEMPYIAKNSSDFWKRWHISLSSWFRDYLYIPMGGSRNGQIRTYANLFVTMLLSGLWHGASFTFIIWGVLHGIYSIVSSIVHKYIIAKNINFKFNNIVFIIFNTSIVWLLWIPFRASDIQTAFLILKRIFTFASGIIYINVFVVVFAFIIMSIQMISLYSCGGKNCIKPLNLDKMRNKIIFVIAVLLILTFAYIGDTAFIYAQF